MNFSFLSHIALQTMKCFEIAANIVVMQSLVLTVPMEAEVNRAIVRTNYSLERSETSRLTPRCQTIKLIIVLVSY